MSEILVNKDKIWVIDFEVDNLNEYNRAFSASPYYEDNKAVNYGACEVIVDPDSGETTEEFVVKNFETGQCKGLEFTRGSETLPWLVCGHNIRFDISYIFKGSNSGKLLKVLESGESLLWDTQFAEYLLSGQKDKMLSLNALSEKYGFEPKHDEVKEMWDAGYKTRDIDPDVLDEYVKQDVKITKDIALRQIARAYEEGMLDFILFQMRSLFVVHEYEWNGMYVDEDKLKDIEAHALAARDDKEALVDFWLMELLGEEGILNNLRKVRGLGLTEAQALFSEWFDIHSTDKIKRLIFGGPLELKIDEHIGTYKTGKKKGEPKYRKTTYTDKMKPFLNPRDIPEEHLTPKGVEKLRRGADITFKDVSLDDKSIEYIKDQVINDILKELLDGVVKYRDFDKLANTYCKGVRDYLFPDGRIHCNLNVDNTPTGRLTSSNPNLQNIPSGDESEFKRIFTSRFPDGKIGTVDFKQLEVVGLAYLTQDPQLRDDLLNGRDIHTETARTAGIDLTGSVDLRRNIKGVNFGTIYGAGVRKLTQQSGLEEPIVRRCVEALKSRYPDAFGKKYIEALERELDLNAFELDRDAIGMKRFGNFVTQPTGRKIWIETVSSTTFGRGMPTQQWPYTCMRNYPVQSIAADIVSVARVLFYDVIRERSLQDKILMVNEVHDEIVFDIRDNADISFRFVVSEVEERLPKELERRLGLQREFDLPLKLEIGLGDSWKTGK